jgi:hypothetical protein
LISFKKDDVRYRKAIKITMPMMLIYKKGVILDKMSPILTPSTNTGIEILTI